MEEADLRAPRSTRISAIALVALLHLLAIMGLIRAFAPGFATRAVETVLSTFSVTVTTTEPAKDEQDAGAAAEAGRKANPSPVAAPVPKVAVARKTAPRAAAEGAAADSGARDAGEGQGGGGEGTGAGSGAGGTGQGGGIARPVKIAGDINSAKDFPRASRDLRIDSEVIVYMTVGTDGRARDCRVVKPSPDPEAGPITCKLAEARFRFKPATDAAGNPVEATYGWRQRWFY